MKYEADAKAIVTFAVNYQHDTLLVRLFDDGTWEVTNENDGDQLLVQQGHWGFGKPPFALISTYRPEGKE